MKLKQWGKILLLTSCVWLSGAISATAQQVPKKEVQSKSVASVLRNSRPIKEIRRLSEIERPSTSAQMLVQSPTPSNSPNLGGEVVPITHVKANATNKGVEVILQTTQGTRLQVTKRTTGNNFIVNVSGGQLRLADGNAFTFRSEKPLPGITEITVTNVDANTVQITVVGEKALPTVELFDDNVGLVFAVATKATATQPPQQSQTPQAEEKPATETPLAQQDEPIELVVTGDQDGYNVPDASTATRTDTPLRDIPQSIQVVPRQVIEDRNVRTLNEATETVSGVTNNLNFNGASGGGRVIRGFFGEGNFRNGFPQGGTFYVLDPIGTIEQVEVLKGPASVLFGALEPGGIVNTVTKQPLSDPYYKLAFEAGNYGFYQPSIDFSGPLTADKTVLYRFIAAYQASEGFQEFVNSDLITIAPSITVNLSDRTKLNLYYEYNRFITDAARSFVALLSDGSLTPKNFYTGYPDLYNSDLTSQKIGYTLRHEFSDNWQLRNSVALSLNRLTRNESYPNEIVNDRFLTSYGTFEGKTRDNNYFGQIDLLGKFNTGSISHQLLVGFDLNYFSGDYLYRGSSINVPDLDILNPNYDVPRPEFDISDGGGTTRTQSYGVYLQDQIALNDNLKLLIGGRYDWLSNENEIGNLEFQREGGKTVQNDGAFSPRIGLVYQPSKTVSLYASYSQSFKQSQGFNSSDGRAFKPSRGTQYEVGVKADFLDGKLSTTLAAYQLTKTNVLTPDPNDLRFSVQTGEQQSRGIELDVGGEILPGWKVIGSYTYNNAEVTEDNSIPVGNRLDNVPENQVSLWTTYQIQTGALKGVGFGLGLFYVGERQGNLANEYTLRDHLRTDAALYYRSGSFKAAINVRNLFDIDYVDYSYGRAIIQRGEPFTIKGSISWEF